MNLRYQDNCENIEWCEVRSLLESVGMSFSDVNTHRISFENSFSVVFVFDGDKMVGMGRAISDGIRQSALYDIAVDPSYQGVGMGKEIVFRIMSKAPESNYILYAAPGKENFYKKMNFKKMKTAMGLFSDPERMKNEDFFFIE